MTSLFHKLRPWRFAIITAFLLALLTTSAPILNWARRPAESVYTGYSYESVGDVFVYLNFIEQTKNGAFLLKDFFTPEAHNGILFNPLYLAIGNMAHLFHLTPLVAWHVARVILLFVFVVFLYHVLGHMTNNERSRRVAFLFILATGAVFLQAHEASTFLSLLYTPMGIATILLSLMYFHFFLHAAEYGATLRRISGLVLLGILQATTHPYVVILWVVVPAAYLFLGALLRERTIRKTLLLTIPPALIGGFYFVYQYLIIGRSPILSAWAQNAMLGPVSWLTLADFLGILGVLAACAIILRRKVIFSNHRLRFFALWLIVGIFISRIPVFPYAYRMFSALHMPLAFFAAMGLFHIWDVAKKRTRLQVFLVFLVIPALSDNLYHMVKNVRNDYRSNQKLYLATDAFQAFQWIRNSTPQEGVLLTSPGWDTLAAEQAYRQVYTTAGWQTTTPGKNISQALRVYEGNETPDELREFFGRNRITLVLVSPLEKQSGAWRFFQPTQVELHYRYGFDPSRYSFLHKAYDKGNYQVYTVLPEVK